MKTEVDRELLRMQILEELSFGKGQLIDVVKRVTDKYQKTRNVNIERVIKEEFFALLFRGCFLPVQDHFYNDWGEIKWKGFPLTEYGESVLDRRSEHPYFVDNYLSRLKGMVPEGLELDEVAEFYVTESAQLFHHDFYSASVVMLGIASEQIVLLIGDAIQTTLKNKTKDDFKKVMERNDVKVKINEICSKFESSCTDANLKDFFDQSFRGFVTLLRRSRNEYGHPSGTSATRDEALEYLYAFPQYIRRMYQVIEYYNKKQKVEEAEE
jgi:hypothetical protein